MSIHNTHVTKINVGVQYSAVLHLNVKTTHLNVTVLVKKLMTQSLMISVQEHHGFVG